LVATSLDYLGLTGTAALQNKDKPKKGQLPHDMLGEGRYMAARTVPDYWICYPWEAKDIDEHDELARQQTNEQ